MIRGGKWSTKYKKSINCRRPKGFSQRQHCKRKKLSKSKYGRGTRRRRRTKNLQRGGNAETERKIKKIFSEDVYDIIYYPVKKQCDIYTKGHTGHDNVCVAFTIKDLEHFICIDILSKCIKSGTDTLDKMDRLAKELGMEELHLADGSGINDCGVNVSLSILDILATGESWYNKMGYKSENYDIEKEANEEIRKRNVKQFTNECIETERQRLKEKNPTIRYEKRLLSLTEDLKTEENADNRERLQKQIDVYSQRIAEYNIVEEHHKIDDELNNIRDVFNEGTMFLVDEGMIVQDYFSNMKTNLQSAVGATKCDKYRFASKLLKIIRNKGDIKYSIDLIKKVA